MKRLSLQWRITLMTVLLIGVTCVAMNLLLCSSGMYYMDTIADTLQGGDTVIVNGEDAASFDPQRIAPEEDLTIVVNGAQGRFRTTNRYITAAVTALSGILAYFVSGRALKASARLCLAGGKGAAEQSGGYEDQRGCSAGVPAAQPLLQPDAGAAEQCLCRPAAVHRQRRPRAAHTAGADAGAAGAVLRGASRCACRRRRSFSDLLREQTERLTQMTKTLLEMSSLQQVARNEHIQLAPMIEEIFTDLAPLGGEAQHHAGRRGRRRHDRQRRADLPSAFQSDGERREIQPPRRLGAGLLSPRSRKALLIRVSDTGCGIPAEYQQSVFQPFFRIDKSRSREYGGAGLGLSLVWEIVGLHGGSVWVEKSTAKGRRHCGEAACAVTPRAKSSAGGSRRLKSASRFPSIRGKKRERPSRRSRFRVCPRRAGDNRNPSRPQAVQCRS